MFRRYDYLYHITILFNFFRTYLPLYVTQVPNLLSYKEFTVKTGFNLPQ